VPRTKSAKKQMRQARTHTARNRSQRSELRTAVKKARSAVGTQSAATDLRTATTLLDRSARKRLIHPNKAARLKSRMAKAAKK
jgi:small subunit ribosomal protein S20